jgi:hypothetical protein
MRGDGRGIGRTVFLVCAAVAAWAGEGDPLGKLVETINRPGDMRRRIEENITKREWDLALELSDSLPQEGRHWHDIKEYKEQIAAIVAFMRAYRQCDEMCYDTVKPPTDTLFACFEQARILGERLPRRLDVSKELFQRINGAGWKVTEKRNELYRAMMEERQKATQAPDSLIDVEEP